MRQIDGKLNNIFGGLNPEISTRKRTGGLLEGHNIEPLKDDYALHSAIIDMNSTYQWSPEQESTFSDIWEDLDADEWTDTDGGFVDYDGDVFEDYDDDYFEGDEDWEDY